MKKVTIVVLNYKNYADTLECLHSLFVITYPNIEIVVVDNDSQNESLAVIAEEINNQNRAYVQLDETSLQACVHIDPKIILFQSQDNRGYAAGNNWGIKIALERHADYILILNNDTVVSPGFLEPLVNFAEQHDDIAVVGPKVLNLKGGLDRGCARRRTTGVEYFFRLGIIGQVFRNNWAIRRHFYIGEYDFDQPKEVDLVSGCCMLIKRDVFQKIGLLDEKTFLNMEEFILHEKLRNERLHTFVVPSSVIMHKQGGSIKKKPSVFVRNASRDSLKYYLIHYRHYSSWLVSLIMLNRLATERLSDWRRGANSQKN